MASFDKLVQDLLEAEGREELTNNPKDRGGLTKYGISQKAYPDLDIASLTEEEAIALYKKDYWDKFKVGTLPEKARRDVFFNVVNSGSAAIRDLQRAIGAEVDGVVGPNTRKALESFEGDVAFAIKEGQIDRYIDIAKSNPSQQKEFMNGWINRAVGSEIFSSRTEDLRSIPLEDVREKALAALEDQRNTEILTPDPVQPSSPSFDPLSFIENLDLLMEARRNAPSRASQEPTEAVTEPEEEVVEEETEPHDFQQAAIDQIRAALQDRTDRGEKKLKRTHNEAKLEALAKGDEEKSLAGMLKSSPEAMEVVKKHYYDRPTNVQKKREEPVRREDARKDPTYGIF